MGEGAEEKIMSARNVTYAELLYLGLLHIRQAARAGRADICGIEADHLHNVPALLEGGEESSHAYYVHTETAAYAEGIRKADGPLDPALLSKYERLWMELRESLNRTRDQATERRAART